MSNRVIHFEIPADDFPRARKFYTEMFGWDIKQLHGPTEYWSAKTGTGTAGINGAFLRRGGAVTSVVNTIEVDDLDAALEKLLACGGAMVGPKIAIEGAGEFAYCKDTEGNVFGMIEPQRRP
ncbi:MAG: VOC family protein [Vulcanimicrobiaceae bacterium]